jgi:hypothetical protein
LNKNKRQRTWTTLTMAIILVLPSASPHPGADWQVNEQTPVIDPKQRRDVGRPFAGRRIGIRVRTG